VGGSNARTGEFPWQVSFQAFTGATWVHFCGGSIISADRIATAAHCCEAVRGLNLDLRIVAGARNIGIQESTQQIKGVSRTESHPQYDDR